MSTSGKSVKPSAEKQSKPSVAGMPTPKELAEYKHLVVRITELFAAEDTEIFIVKLDESAIHFAQTTLVTMFRSSHKM